MYSELEGKCASLYESINPNQRYYTDKCKSLVIDANFVYGKESSIVKSNFTCNIPGVNITSNVGVFMNLYSQGDTNTCPIGGWCDNSNNFFLENGSEITTQFTLTKSDGTTEPICPQNIFNSSGSGDGSSSGSSNGKDSSGGGDGSST